MTRHRMFYGGSDVVELIIDVVVQGQGNIISG